MWKTLYFSISCCKILCTSKSPTHTSSLNFPQKTKLTLPFTPKEYGLNKSLKLHDLTKWLSFIQLLLKTSCYNVAWELTTSFKDEETKSRTRMNSFGRKSSLFLIVMRLFTITLYAYTLSTRFYFPCAAGGNDDFYNIIAL